MSSGNVLQVGAFGLPTGDARAFKTDTAVAPDGTNFDSLTEPGTFRLLIDMAKSTFYRLLLSGLADNFT